MFIGYKLIMASALEMFFGNKLIMDSVLKCLLGINWSWLQFWNDYWKECPSMSLENYFLANQIWENFQWAANLELIHNRIWKILAPDRVTDQVSQLFEIPWRGKLVCKQNCLFKHGNFNAKFMQKFWIQNHFWNDVIGV